MIEPTPRPEPKASITAPPVEKGQRTGWLSDLLDRASQDEAKAEAPATMAEPTAPAITITPLAQETPKVEAPREPIAALLADINQIVDDRSVALLWSNYLKGEPAAFSEAIYTHDGKQRYAELTQAIAQDERFRTSVEAYTTKFEAVLRDLTTTDQDGSITRSILASAEGRVYTVLAHVSNRFE
jgi:hypothetical protein